MIHNFYQNIFHHIPNPGVPGKLFDCVVKQKEVKLKISLFGWIFFFDTGLLQDRSGSELRGILLNNIETISATLIDVKMVLVRSTFVNYKQCY